VVAASVFGNGFPGCPGCPGSGWTSYVGAELGDADGAVDVAGGVVAVGCPVAPFRVGWTVGASVSGTEAPACGAAVTTACGAVGTAVPLPLGSDVTGAAVLRGLGLGVCVGVGIAVGGNVSPLSVGVVVAGFVVGLGDGNVVGFEVVGG